LAMSLDALFDGVLLDRVHHSLHAHAIDCAPPRILISDTPIAVARGNRRAGIVILLR